MKAIKPMGLFRKGNRLSGMVAVIKGSRRQRPTSSYGGLCFRKRMWQGCVDHYALLQQSIEARATSAASPCGKAEYLHTEERVPADCLPFL